MMNINVLIQVNFKNIESTLFNNYNKFGVLTGGNDSPVLENATNICQLAF